MCSNEKIIFNREEDTYDDDLITLGELTEYENTIWKFPQTKRCPARSCGKMFKTKCDAIKHYRDNHAKHAVLCKICNYPLMLMTAAHHLVGHYARIHPQVTPPVKVKTVRHECSVCHASFKNFVYLTTHMKNVHNRKKNKKRSTKTNKKVKRTKLLTNSHRVSLDTSNANIKNDEKIEYNKSPSWEDIESDNSISMDEYTLSEAADDNTNRNTLSDSIVVQKKPNKMTSKRRLIKCKDRRRSFNLLQKPCPCNICGINLNNYVLACNHYRKVHGRTVGMCPFCKSYFANSIKFIHHMMTRHHTFANEDNKKMSKCLMYAIKLFQLSTNFARKITVSTTLKKRIHNETSHHREKVLASANNRKYTTATTELIQSEQNNESVQMTFMNGKMSSDSDNNIDENYIVTLGEFTEYPTEQWQFPQTTSCPRLNCKQKFRTRDEAVQHYRTTHAHYDVLCKECNVLVSLSGSHNLLNHYRRKHPDIEMPPKSNESKTACRVCQKVLSYPQLRIHMNVKHGETQHAQISKKSSRILKRKASLNLTAFTKKPNAELPTQGTNSLRALLRSKSVSYVANFISSTLSSESVCEDEQQSSDSTPPVPASPSNRNDILNIRDGHDQNIGLPHIEAATESLPAKMTRRSTTVRNKACTICGIVLINYMVACDHYSRIHGRNVLMCPYCQQYFLLSNLLTKHVLTTHSVDNSYAESPKIEPIDTQTNSSAINNEPETCPKLEIIQSTTALNVKTMNDVIVTNTLNSEFDTGQSHPIDEPVDLTIPKISDQAQSGIIDLISGALDLTIKK